jgi:hypothetical protein
MVSFVLLSFCDTIHVEFVFFILMCVCVLNFVLKTLGIINLYLVSTNIVFHYLRSLKNDILINGIMVSFSDWDH